MLSMFNNDRFYIHQKAHQKKSLTKIYRVQVQSMILCFGELDVTFSLWLISIIPLVSWWRQGLRRPHSCQSPKRQKQENTCFCSQYCIKN